MSPITSGKSKSHLHIKVYRTTLHRIWKAPTRGCGLTLRVLSHTTQVRARSTRTIVERTCTPFQPPFSYTGHRYPQSNRETLRVLVCLPWSFANQIINEYTGVSPRPTLDTLLFGSPMTLSPTPPRRNEISLSTGPKCPCD